MPDWPMIQKFLDLVMQGYLGSLGAWVQIQGPVTTRLNAFNTLGEQHMVTGLFDPGGNLVGELWEGNLASGHALRLDLRTLLPAGTESFEGSLWMACRGLEGDSNLGIQAMDLDFVDETRPAGHVLGTAHLMQDFFNTLSIGPWLDLISPRLMVGVDSDGASRWTNYLGMAHFPYDQPAPAIIEVRVANEAGDWITAPESIEVPLFGSAFVSIDAMFPQLHEHLLQPGKDVGYGAVNLREITPGSHIGLCAMLKVTDNETGDFMVDHLNDRNFAKPTQKG